MAAAAVDIKRETAWNIPEFSPASKNLTCATIQLPKCSIVASSRRRRCIKFLAKGTLTRSKPNEEFVEWLLALQPHRELIFIDESGFKLWIQRNRGRALRRDRAFRQVEGRQYKNLTSVFAVSSTQGLLHHDLINTNINAEKMTRFFNYTVQCSSLWKSVQLNQPFFSWTTPAFTERSTKSSCRQTSSLTFFHLTRLSSTLSRMRSSAGRLRSSRRWRRIIICFRAITKNDWRCFFKSQNRRSQP